MPATTAEVPAAQRYWRSYGANRLVLKPAPAVDEHRFVVFSHTFDGRPMPPGTDVAQASQPAEALAKAWRTGAVTISETSVLRKDRTLPRDMQQQSFMTTAPVFHAPAADGSRALRGWVLPGWSPS